MIEFYCPNCGRKYQLEDRFVGLRARCSACKANYYIGRCGVGSMDAGDIPVVPVTLSLGEGSSSAEPLSSGTMDDLAPKAESIPSTGNYSTSPARISTAESLLVSGDISPASGTVTSGLADPPCQVEPSTEHDEIVPEPSVAGGGKLGQPYVGEVPVDSVELSGDWRRFFARHLDFLACYFFLYLLLAILVVISNNPLLFEGLMSWPKVVVGVLLLLILFLLESVVYSVLGTTLGKWLMGVAIVDRNCRPLDGVAYFKRNLLVFLQGLGLGLPLLHLASMSYQSQRMKKGEKPSYDETLGTQAIVKGRNAFKSLVGFLLLIIGLILFVSLWSLENTQGR